MIRRAGDLLAIVLLLLGVSRAYDAAWVSEAEAGALGAFEVVPLVLPPQVTAVLDEMRGHEAQGRYERAAELVDAALADGVPDASARAQLLKAASHVGRSLGDWPMAAGRMRQAVKADPDLLEPSLDRYVGDELKVFVSEAARRIPERQRVQASPQLAQALRDTYYLQRRLAGGCE